MKNQKIKIKIILIYYNNKIKINKIYKNNMINSIINNKIQKLIYKINIIKLMIKI